MHLIKKKITRHAKKQACREEKNSLIETDSEIAQMKKLVDKNIGTLVISHIFKKVEESMSMLKET